MQPIAQMNNVQKSRLLHELFPDEIPGLINYTENLCLSIAEHKEQLATRWQHPLISIELWLELADEVRSLIEQKRVNIERSGIVFSEQLLPGYTICL